MGKSKRPRDEDEDGDDGSASSSAFTTINLRSREVTVFAMAKRSRGIGRDTENIVYTAGPGERAAHGRSSMGDRVTRDMLEHSLAGPASPFAMRIQPMKGGRTQLKAQNVSRNHILADSRIRIMLLRARAVLNQRDRDRGASSSSSSASASPARTSQEEAVAKFLKALAGEAVGEDLYNRFEASRGNPKRIARFNAVIDKACVGVLNLRFGEARTNGQISNLFDPVVIDGRLSPETARIANAVRRLAREGLIPFDVHLDALAVAKDRATFQDVTSSAFAADGSVATRIAAIDYFRGSSALAGPRRRSSFSTAAPARERRGYKEPAREFHATSPGYAREVASAAASSSLPASGGSAFPSSAQPANPFAASSSPSSALPDAGDITMRSAMED
jgi:hypothetical protein